MFLRRWDFSGVASLVAVVVLFGSFDVGAGENEDRARRNSCRTAFDLCAIGGDVSGCQATYRTCTQYVGHFPCNQVLSNNCETLHRI